MTAAELNPFQRWVADAVRQAGVDVPAEIDPLGLSFEAEGRVARIFPHADAALAVIEVTAVAMDDIPEDAAARLALLLLRLNHEARFEHGWSIVIDEGNRLNVTTTISVSDTEAGMLPDILYDGVDRASALSTVVARLLSSVVSASGRAPALEPDTMPSIGPIRA